MSDIYNYEKHAPRVSQVIAASTLRFGRCSRKLKLRLQFQRFFNRLSADAAFSFCIM